MYDVDAIVGAEMLLPPTSAMMFPIGVTNWKLKATRTDVSDPRVPCTFVFVTVTFEALRGLANAAVLNTSVSGTSAQLRVTSDAMGRVQMCSPSGALKGYTAC